MVGIRKDQVVSFLKLTAFPNKPLYKEAPELLQASSTHKRNIFINYRTKLL